MAGKDGAEKGFGFFGRYIKIPAEGYSMASKIELRQINRNNIYRCIYESGGISRQEIALKTGLSIPTIIQNLSDLEGRNLITADGVFQSTGGRRARVIRCVLDAAYGIGIDITQNHVTIVVVDLSGDIVCGGVREKFPYQDTEHYYDTLAFKLEQLLERNGIDRKKVLGVGISMPCIVDTARNYVTYGRLLGAPADIYKRFASRLPYRVEIFNDANSGGFAETWKSEQENMVFYLMLSNSVGGAIIDRDEIYLGDNFRSSEIGHLKIVPDGAPCYCGQKGCVNAYCSAQLLSDRTDGNLEQFFAKVDEGDPECVQALDTYLDYLAVTVINLRMMLDCGIILGGYVGAYMDRCVEKLRERITKLNPYETDSAFVQPCHYKTEASAVGAGLPFIKKFMMEI